MKVPGSYWNFAIWTKLAQEQKDSYRYSSKCIVACVNSETMTAPINGTVTPPALYTVEQLELIRRLRNSGISREDVANAFDTFDRLDRELGPVYNIPVTLVSYFTFVTYFWSLSRSLRCMVYFFSCLTSCFLVICTHATGYWASTVQ